MATAGDRAVAKPQACPLRTHNPVGHPKNNLALMKSMDSAVTREIWATVEHREGNEAGWGKNGRQGLPKSVYLPAFPLEQKPKTTYPMLSACMH